MTKGGKTGKCSGEINQRDKVGKGSGELRQRSSSERRDIKKGVLVTGIKGIKCGTGKREGRNMAQREVTLRWVF